LKSIPAEERLEAILKTGSRQAIKDRISKYEGDNSLIMGAKEHFH